MANIKTVTPREMIQITNAICDKPKTILWHGKRININPLLEFKDFFDLIGDIITHCIKDGKMIIESVDFVFKAKSIERYGGISLPNDINEQYKIIYSSDLVQTIFNEVNAEQLKSIKQIIQVYTGLTL